MGRDEGMTEGEGWRQTRREKELKQAERIEAALYLKKEKGGRVTEKKKRQKQKKRQRRWGTDFTLARPGAVVWYEPSSAGVRLGWAHLTGVTPRPSHCGAAQSLCAHNACELALTHLVIHRGEARSSAVVCRGKAGGGFCLFISSTNTTQNSKVW